MTAQYELDGFVKSYVKDLEEDSAAVFAGAGMSKAAGYVDWPELLRDIAAELGLEVEKEHDLISLAQFHVNTRKNTDGLAKKILQEFSEQAEPTETHDILARLPLRTYWTTNYDSLIENGIRKAYKVPDVKFQVDQLTHSRPKRDAVVYKMHGDVQSPKNAILYKEQYEKYHVTHAPFITALSGDLVSKTFLFIGFSFTDPNLDYVLSRLHGGIDKRAHYCFMKAATASPGDDDEIVRYKKRKQELRVDDLKRFGIQTLLLDSYEAIPKVLSDIEARYRKKTIFISGSAEVYGSWDRQEALNFTHLLAAECVKANLRVVNGFGWGIGSAVINGALEAIYGDPRRYTESQLIVRPFPQFGADLKTLWEEYRQRMISLAGIAIFLFGNKQDKGNIISANGVRREFEIALQHGLIPVPIGATEFMAHEIWAEVMAKATNIYQGHEKVIPMVQQLGTRPASDAELVKRVLEIVRELNR